MKSVTTIVLLALLCTSCSTLMSATYTPTIRQLEAPDTPQHAYAKALTIATTQMGGTKLQEDRQGGGFSVILHHAVELRVTVQPREAGSLVEARGILLANKLVIGTMTEVDDFIAAYKKGA